MICKGLSAKALQGHQTGQGFPYINLSRIRGRGAVLVIERSSIKQTWKAPAQSNLRPVGN